MGKCKICNNVSETISKEIGLCLDCIRNRPEEALYVSQNVHSKSRILFGLPNNVPKDKDGILCALCANNCKIAEGRIGYCGLVENVQGRLVRYGGIPSKGVLEWYYDPLPTNCVAEWFCPGCTGLGFPKYANMPTAEIGYKNLAVFYGACSFDCLYCQNWHYRRLASKRQPIVTAEDLASKVDKKVSCICYFGGDPSPQILHAIRASEIAFEKSIERGSILRICWETNGYINRELAKKAAELSLKSGGIIKFDIKAWNPILHNILCGVSNEPTLENFKQIFQKYYHLRPEVPLLTASTLLVPGYVDAFEIEQISKFLADLDPNIPYTLLAFYPQYMLYDLPTTRSKHAHECYERAKRYLRNVRIGNVQLLS
ncbi:MAG: radical SAM protein [Nitrososphaeria archaeon]